jgi:hypothetical protein
MIYDVPTGDPGHAKIGDYQVDLPFTQPSQGVFSTPGSDHCPVSGCEDAAQAFEHGRVVVDQQDRGGAAWRPAICRRNRFFSWMRLRLRTPVRSLRCDSIVNHDDGKAKFRNWTGDFGKDDSLGS